MNAPRKALQDALALLCATFRVEVDTWQVRAYERALDGVEDRWLLAAADRLIEQAAAGRKFYGLPTAPQLKGAIAEVVDEARQRAAALLLASCEHPSHFEYDEQDRVRRCACYRQAMKAMDAVAAPVALLPSYTDAEVTRDI
jgi:hypothetical protein